jgi:hypothetical protein
VARGLNGVKPVTSDAHGGRNGAISCSGSHAGFARSGFAATFLDDVAAEAHQ